MEFINNRSTFSKYESQFYEFLLENNQEELREILKKPDLTKHYSLEILFIELPDNISEAIINFAEDILPILDRAAQQAVADLYERAEDKNILVFKPHIHVRFLSMVDDSSSYRTIFPGCKDVGQFMGLVGTIVRVSQGKLLEFKKFYRCNKCKQTMIVEAVASRWYAFPKMDQCENGCANAKLEEFDIGEGAKSNASNYSRVKDYQEVKLQEQISNRSGFGTIPKALWVILEDDLVDKCKPGDDVVITGILFLRWRSFRKGQPIVSEVAFKANHVEVKNDQRASVQIGPDTLKFFDEFWAQYESNPFSGRNTVLRSICPHVYGMYLVKLAVCVVLAGGVSKESGGVRVRGQSHLLLVGDPGTGKSQILKYISKIIPRSVFTTGAGTTNAGLTVSAVRDNGEWHLEAGALVLADSGVCCIDEFSHIREHDRTSIHEAMEQQSISVAKAGMVCKLGTKCSVIAATNPKISKYDPAESLEMNIGLASPLLSRFDLIIALKDAQNESWDEFLSDFILKDVDVFAYHADQARKSGLIWDNDTVQSYLVLIKDKDPEMTEDAALVLNQYFKRQRNSVTRNAARTTVRLLESLYRLAEGHARIMYKDFVSIHDSITAVTLIEASMQSAALGPTQNSLHIAFPEDPIHEYYGQAQKVLQTLDLPELWEREKIYLEHLIERNARENMPPPPPPLRAATQQTNTNQGHRSRARTLINDNECADVSSATKNQNGSQKSNPSQSTRNHEQTCGAEIMGNQNTSQATSEAENCDSPELFPDEDFVINDLPAESSHQDAFMSTQNSNFRPAHSHASERRPNFGFGNDEFDEDICTPIPLIEDEEDIPLKTYGNLVRTPARGQEIPMSVNTSDDGIRGRVKRKRDDCSRSPPTTSTSTSSSASSSANSSIGSLKDHSKYSILQRFRRVPRTQD